MGKSTGTSTQAAANGKRAAALGGYYRHRSPPPGLNYWPCKLDGCKKQFQREADLRRHQRTSRTHSKATHICPQCEATFTRPDACRRHQRSKHGTVSEPLVAPASAGANEEDDGSTGADGDGDGDGDGMSGSGDEDVRDVREELAGDVLSEGDDESDSAMSEDAPLSEDESAATMVAVAPEATYAAVYTRTTDEETTNPLEALSVGESKPALYPSPYYRITAPSWHCGPFSIDRYVCHPTSNARNSPDESTPSDEEEEEDDEKDASRSGVAFVKPASDAHYYHSLTLRPKADAFS
ncbi:hypothetical protein BD626DRAFT_477505 [Schizophyllum amplum]|uniref:C2H2-type domain-containing protein n=1 Tax=Schizophyllum amplum TaxID=97359 RepID=A0A550D096_9AGAR|nr:hypothetical protein BD626DRAFT_477505 [Auriculariopsis ampla]